MAENFEGNLREQMKNTPPINQLAEDEKKFEEAVDCARKYGNLTVIDYTSNKVQNIL